MSVHSLKMTTVQYIRKLLGKSSCATNNLLNTGHKTQKSTSDYKLTKNTERHKQNVVQPQDKTAEQCIRRDVILRREENETFGFDIQTSSSERTVGAEQDLSSCVCWVKENSPAMDAGLTTGDVIITVNSVYITGFTHQEIHDLMQKSTMLKMEMIRDATVKQRQLLGKLYLLQNTKEDILKKVGNRTATIPFTSIVQRTDTKPIKSCRFEMTRRELTEKCEELQTIITQDVRLSRGVSENN